MLANMATEVYYECCGKTICRGCVDSFAKSGNDDKCPFCNSDRDKTDEERIEELMKRVEANDAVQFLCWVHIMTMDYEVCSRIRRGQRNYGLRPRSLDPARRILPWVDFMSRGRFEESQVPL
jgi:hypothetical protein